MASPVPPVETVISGPSGVTSTEGSIPLSSGTPHVPGISSPQPSSKVQSAHLNYAKAWEGNLYGKRQDQPVFITRLEGYRSIKASETLAANWPSTMEIVRLISVDHMNNKQFVEKADFLVFWAMDQHAFLRQLQEKKLCAVIQLPSQTLLLSVSDKLYRLIGMVFPSVVHFTKRPISKSTTASTSTSARPTAATAAPSENERQPSQQRPQKRQRSLEEPL